MATITEYVEFNGVKTSDFNFIASGENTFNAPARVYEMIDIPGRDGQFALDMGRFENIDVPYHCTNHEPNDMATFRANLDGLRNAFLSARGYQRLEDTFHPDEYRMAVYKSGLEAKMIGQAYASEFDLVFNCKPQRFLKSGETAVSVASGSSITNPTAFESKPLIEFGGYGTITVNGYAVTLNSGPIGNITLANATSMGTNNTQTFSTASLNTGDAITLDASEARLTVSSSSPRTVDSITYTQSGALDVTPNLEYTSGYSRTFLAHFAIGNTTPFSCVKGTTKTQSAQVVLTVTFTNSTSITITCNISCKYDKDADTIKLTLTTSTADTYLLQRTDYQLGAVTGVSSQSALGNPIYVDCELGDCYKYEDGEMVFLNSYISMPNDLPVLSAGSNTITYDNTITSFKITPRWWRI